MPTQTDDEKLDVFHKEKHGFPSMIESIDCNKWPWAQCPAGLCGQLRSNNDINVIRQSPLLNDLKEEEKAPEVLFVANEELLVSGVMAGDNDNSNKNGDKSIGSSSELNLSFGDSLYLHPNDTGGSPIVTIKDNFKPALANQWEMYNSIVFTWILNSLSFDLYASVVYAKSSYELWNDFKNTYDKVYG
nr:hypothetical protein [Tanacetum cinerariifolium]